MNELLTFIASHRAEMATRLGEHVVLVAASTAIAAAMGIPLGLIAARRPALARPIVAVANLARWLKVDPEAALRDTNAKFERRFRRVEELLRQIGKTPEESNLEEMDRLWNAAKKEEPGR